ncbi:MAG: hypothetical protein ACUVSK_14700, partial [Desulfotomaculales bacterium]
RCRINGRSGGSGASVPKGREKFMKKPGKFGLQLALFLAVGLLAGLGCLLSPSPTPEAAIRKDVFLRGLSPGEAFHLRIKRGDYVDPQYGQQFVVEGFRDNGTGMEIQFFYLKKTPGGWRVVSAGTGP